MAFYLNRYICDVLEEMRKLNETRNYSMLASLIEEVQTMANRMEASLSDVSDIKELADQRKELKEEKTKLKREIKQLERKKQKLLDKEEI